MNFINIHTHYKSKNNTGFAILNKYPNDNNFNSPFSIGIHPWYINKNLISEDFQFIENQLAHPQCFAIGECGLDKLTETDFHLQTSVFKHHILLSEKYKKPLIIHCVKSFQEIIQLKKELKPKQPWIIHGFNKNTQVALSLIKNNCFISFGKSLLLSKKLQEVFKEIPLDVIFFETDDELTDITLIYKKAALIKNIELKKLQNHIHQNYNRTFTK